MRIGALFCITAAIAHAQTADTAGIRGTVSDRTGAAIASAHVVLENVATGFRREADANREGIYSFNQLPITGDYRLTANSAGFAFNQSAALQLRTGETAEVDFVLSVEETSSSVTVSGTVTGVLSDSAQVADFLLHKDIDAVAISANRATSLPLLDSSVRPARGTGDLFIGKTLFVINGGGRKQTSYSVDGVSADDAWNRQTVFSDVPFAAIEEMAVLANAFSSEYGWGNGGVVQVNTISGTNAPHGDFSADWRPGGIQARPPLAIRSTPDRLWQGSGVLSGPIVRNKLFYSLASEIDRQDRDAVVTSFFAPGSVFHGHIERELGMSRLDGKWSDRHFTTLELRLDRLYDTNPSDLVSGATMPSAARYFQRNTYTAQIGDTWILTDRSINEFRAALLVGSPITAFGPFTPSTQFVYSNPGAVIGDSRAGFILNHQYQLSDGVSLARGRHDLRLGVDALYSSSGGNGQETSGFVLGQFKVKPGVKKPPDQLKPSDIAQYVQVFGPAAYHATEWVGAAFVQDNWKVRPDLTLMMGLRYEGQSLSDDRHDWMPRLGIAWQPGRGTNTVVRASYGLYYSQIRAVIAGDYTLSGPNGTSTLTTTPKSPDFPVSLKPWTSLPSVGIRDIVIAPGARDYYSQFFDVSKLRRYPEELLNPRTQLTSAGVEHKFSHDWIASADFTDQHTTRIDRQLDLNAPSAFIRTAPGQSRSSSDADKTRPITPAPGGYRRIVAVVNDGWSIYKGARFSVRHHLTNRLGIMASYTLSDAKNTVEPDANTQDPNDANLLGTAELGPSLLNQRHRAVLTASYSGPHNWSGGMTQYLASGQPFAILASQTVDVNGDGVSTADRPVIDGQVVGRNAGKGTPSYSTSLFVERALPINERVRVLIRAEGFNLLNHDNFTGRYPYYGNDPSGKPAATFGAPLPGTPNADPGRQFQFQLRLKF
jgi:hypothetical protein